MNGADIILAFLLLLCSLEALAIGLLFFLRQYDLQDHRLCERSLRGRSDVLWEDYVERVKGRTYIDPALLAPPRGTEDEILAEAVSPDEDFSVMPAQIGPWTP